MSIDLNTAAHSGLGRCTLVGAGPGDPELLTLKAVRAIREADFILVDDLVNPEVLSHAKPSARIVSVGKRGGCRSTPQAFIHRLMLRAVRRGQFVVRLKGGDPCIFGRGGEEVDFMRAHGIEIEIINGITSGLAAMTTLGAPLTHRDHAQGVIFLTGHAQAGGAPPDWPALARQAHDHRLTLVIYMGMHGLPSIHRGLLDGLPPSTPVAVVERATLEDQREAVCTLGGLLDTVRESGLGSPAIVIVGDVVQATRHVYAGMGSERNHAHMRGHDLPAFRETHPGLALKAAQ